MDNETKAKKICHEYTDATCCGSPMARSSVAFNAAMDMARWKDEHTSYELINKICQLFMEHEAIEKYDKNAIEWIYNQLAYEQRR